MRCEIFDVTEKYDLLHVTCDDVVEFLNLKVDEIQQKTISGCEVLVYRSDRLGICGFDVRVLRQDKQVFIDFLKKNSYSESSHEDVDVTKGPLLREGKLNRALHFDKGCYLGQEIVARLKYRGRIL